MITSASSFEANRVRATRFSGNSTKYKAVRPCRRSHGLVAPDRPCEMRTPARAGNMDFCPYPDPTARGPNREHYRCQELAGKDVPIHPHLVSHAHCDQEIQKHQNIFDNSGFKATCGQTLNFVVFALLKSACGR